MAEDLYLAIDVGTGSVRAALVGADGDILVIRSREHEQIVPAFGWSEQRPDDWWAGVSTTVREAVDAVEGARARIAAVCVCGQMHGTVLVDGSGRLARPTVPLWNDKRTAPEVERFERASPAAGYLAQTGNPATPAWPGFKLQWLRDNDPQAYAAAATVLMPKDYINFRLTGAAATDRTEAACSFLMDCGTGEWSSSLCDRLGLEAAKLPPIRMPDEILAPVSTAGAEATGLAAGTPVLVGGGDYPLALLGSGACRPGLASDVTGTSAIITVIGARPLLDAEICNVATAEGNWGSFVLLDSGGDSVRWARRAFHENSLGYGEIVAKAAAAPPGSDALFFLPYLVGERLGRHRNARAQFFGLAAAHGLPHLHRAVLEGVAFAVARHLRIMERAAGRTVERVIASGGGAKTDLWLRIKASAYGVPILVPAEPECSVIGCAALAATATGRFGSCAEAAAALVRYAEEVPPDPGWAEMYHRMQPVFDRLYEHAQAMYDELDRLQS